jgi:hypothetical protein
MLLIIKGTFSKGSYSFSKSQLAIKCGKSYETANIYKAHFN